MKDLTTAYFEIIKADKRDDGTLMVYGKATDDSLDIDQQICDPLWLDRAMPEWFKSGGNIREQHSSIAAGVAKEYEKKADGHYIHALVVDPISVKKVDTGVLKGFSIGIKSPRVVRDQKAANGRIIDGQIVEVSLVDRPANPNCQLVLAKSVDGETGMWKTEELIEKEQTREANGRFGASDSAPEQSGGKEGISEEASARMKDHADKARSLSQDLANNPKDDPYRDKCKQDVDKARQSLDRAAKTNDPAKAREELGKAKTQLDRAVNSLEDENYHTEAEVAYNLGKDVTNTMVRLKLGKSASIALQLSAIEDVAEKRALLMKNAQEIIELSKSIVPADIVKFDQKLYDDARRALAQLIVVEANEMDAGSNEEMSIAHLLTAVHHLLEWYEGEVAEGEVMDPVTEDIEMSAAPEDKPTEDKPEALCANCNKSEKMCKCSGGFKAADDKKKSAEAHKCLECGCDKPADSHGRADVTTAEIVAPEETPKSAEPTEEIQELEDRELPVVEEASAEEKVSEESNLSEEIEAIVEKAIKSATESLKLEIAELANANKAAVEKAVGLESELAVTKSLAVAGGPKRTIKPVDHSTNDLLVKAATYKAKADATTDPDLMKGYKLLSQKYFAEADILNKSN